MTARSFGELDQSRRNWKYRVSRRPQWQTKGFLPNTRYHEKHQRSGRDHPRDVTRLVVDVQVVVQRIASSRYGSIVLIPRLVWQMVQGIVRRRTCSRHDALPLADKKSLSRGSGGLHT